MPAESTARELTDQAAPTPDSVLESITDAFVAFDRDFRYVWVNSEAERFTGMSRERLIGHSVWELFPAVVGTTFDYKIRQALHGQIPVEFESYYSPSKRWFYNRVYPTKDGGLSVFWRDMTEQKRAENDLRRQATVLAQVHDSIVVTDLQGVITDWNRGAVNLYGYEAHEVLGRPVSMLYFEEDRARIAPVVIGPLLRDGQNELEMRTRRKSGEECFIRLSLSLLRDEADQPYAMLGVATDITDRKQAEERDRCLINAMPQVAWITGPDGRAQMVNRFWEEYSGVSFDRTLDLNWISWVHPDDTAPHIARWMKCVETGEPFESEYRLRNKGGEYRWHLVRAVPVRSDNGSVTRWVGTSTDIHDLKNAQEALRASEERLRLASQAVEGFVYDWNPRTGQVQRFGSPENIIGIPLGEAEETEGWWQARIHPEDAARSSLSILRALPPDQTHFETEFRFRHAQGHWVELCDRGYVVRDDKGDPVRVVGSTHDITERRRLQREVEEQSRRLKFQAHILETTNDAVIALDSNLRIRYCNAAAERMYGVRMADVAGKPLTAMHGEAWLAAEDEARRLTDLRERGMWTGEYIHVLNDGTQRVVNCTVNTLAFESGGGMVSVIRDVTERKRAELRARNDAARLARANEDLLHFAYAAGHDLEAPVRTVNAFSQMLDLKYREGLGEDGARLLGHVLEAGARMKTQIRDLLEFARVAGGEVHFSDDVALEQSLAAALANLRIAVEETGAMVTHDALPAVLADAGQMVQLFQNLLGNSLKYRKPDAPPRIHVSAERVGEEWVVAVRDNGIGFEPRHSERIFGVFQRLHGREFSGTGIGLTIGKRIVERRGGRIWAEGTPGEGAVFRFSIPDSADALSAAPPLEWDRVQGLLAEPTPATEVAPFAGDASRHPGPFDELFRTLDLAQCLVRDLDGTIRVWTRGAERMFGWSRAEAIGQRAHELLAAEHPQPLHEIEAELLRNDEWTGQLRARYRGGREIWLASHWALYRDGSGRPQSVIEVFSDITALKEAEEALRRSTEQRDLALSAGRMGVWQWDSRSNRVEWDPTVEALLGLPPGTFEGTYEALRERIHPDDRAGQEAQIREAFENGPEYQHECRIRHADGRYRWWHGQGRVTFAGGKPAGLMGVVWDITDRKQSELDREFRLDLSAKFSQYTDRRALADLAVKEVAAYLGVSRCSYIEIDLAEGLAECVAEFRNEGPSALRTHSLAAFGEAMSDLAANRVVVVEDTRADPRTAAAYDSGYGPLGVRASLAVPLHRQFVWRCTISASDARPRRWEEREIALLRGVAERLWPAIENARLLGEARERQEQFERTFEQAAVGLSHVAPDGRWLRVNRRVCQITGYSREELLAGRFQDITHPDDLEKDVSQYAALKRGDIQTYSIEKRYLRKDGSIVWINLTVSLVREESGAPRYAISVIEDITERREIAELAELRLREIEAIYAQAPVGLVFLDAELRHVRINEYMAKINGLPVAEHIGRPGPVMAPDLSPNLEPILRKVLETRNPVIEMEVRGTTAAKPGVECYWLASYFPVVGPDGTTLGINGVVQDITERKRAEAARLEAAERLKFAASAARLGIYTFDRNSDVSIWENDLMYEITGRRREDGPMSRAEFLKTLIHPDDAEAFGKTMTEAVLRGDSYRSECRIRRPDGQIRQVEFSGRFDIGVDGKPARLIGVMADITDRKEAEQATRDRRQLLLKVLDSLYTFVGVMSPEGVLLEANQAPLEGAGIQAEEVIGKFLPDTYWWSYSVEVQERLWQAIRKAQAGEASRFDIPARMKGGSLMTLDWMIAPLRDDNGAIEYLIPSAVPIEERKRTEEALRKSEERYLLAEWATNDGLWDWTPETDYCYFSPRFKALLGLTDDELENRAAAVFARLHPDDESRLFEAVRLNWEERRPYDLEIRIRMKDGGYRWFRTRGQSVRDELGRAVRMVGAITDIHDRKQAEALAREQDEQWRHMVDGIEQLAWIVRADGVNEWFNRRWYEYTGLTQEQMGDWRSVHDPEVLPAVMERWAESIRTGQAFEMEFPVRGADGVYRAFLTRATAVRDSSGEVVRWFGTSTNIDAMRRERDLLKESERQFRELAEALPEMMWAADAQGGINYWNPKLYAYTGVSAGHGYADNWVSIMHPDDAARIYETWQRSAAEGQDYEFEARMRRHDGVYRWFLHRAEPIRDAGGRVVRWIGTSTDIHAQKTTEEALRRSNEDLEQFAWAASHDLQEPLRTVSIYSQLLSQRYGDQGGEAEKFARYIVGAAKHMDHLLKGILEYSRAGDPAESAGAIDSTGAFESALRNLQPAIAESGVTITRRELPVVVFPEAQLVQLFQNLIGNAIKYRQADGPDAPWVHVSAVRDGRWQRFAVEDNGIGIGKEYLEQIFGVFKRLHRGEYPGAGVGLAVCRRIVERQGGKIRAESEPGKGTTFFFTVPAEE